jgi:hypothetical protein
MEKFLILIDLYYHELEEMISLVRCHPLCRRMKVSKKKLKLDEMFNKSLEAYNTLKVFLRDFVPRQRQPVYGEIDVCLPVLERCIMYNYGNLKMYIDAEKERISDLI